MSELPEERAAVQRAVDGLEFEPFLYERDANAAIASAKEQWESVLAESSACIVILYRKLGEYTKGEIEYARKMSTPILLYRKKDAARVIEAEHGDYLHELENVETGVSARYFEEAADLETIVAEDVHNLLADVFERYRRWEQCGLAARRRRAEGQAAGLEVREARRPEIIRKTASEVEEERVDKPPPVFAGREDDAADLARALEAEDRAVPVAVMGPYGIGRRSLVRHLVHGEDSRLAGLYPDGFGVIPHGEETTTEDLLQAIWEIFFAVEDECRPVALVDADERRGDLEGIGALIVVEDAALGREALVDVAGRTRRSRLAVTTDMTPTEWMGPGVTLRGLGDDDAVAVFAAAYGRPFPGGVGESLASLFARVGGSPYLIRRLAQQAAHDIPRSDTQGEMLAQWAAAVAGMGIDELADNLVPAEARAAFDAVRAVDAPIPFTVFGQTPVGAESPAAAVKKEAVETNSPQVKVNPALGSLTTPPANADALRDDMLDGALDWADAAPPDEIFENRRFVLKMLDWAAERRRWDDAIRLARSTEHAMAVGGRHGAWQRVLEAALEAARAKQPADLATEAWALHQLGSMALLRDQLADARTLLHDALDKRQAIGDTSAAALSRANLGLIPMAIVSVALLVLGFFTYPAWLGSTAAPGLIGELSIDEISFAPVTAPAVEPVTEDLVLRSGRSTEAEFVATIADERGSGVFCVDGVCGAPGGTAGAAPPSHDGRAAGWLMPGQPLAAATPVGDCPSTADEQSSALTVTVPPDTPCRLVVSFFPQDVGSYRSILTFTAAGGDTALDIALAGEAVSSGDAASTTTTTEASTTTTTTTVPPVEPPGTTIVTRVGPDGPGGDTIAPPLGAGIDVSVEPRLEPAAIVYEYSVANTGEAPLRSVRLTGGLLGSDAYTCGTSQLEPGDSTECFSVYALTETDLERMEVVELTSVLAGTLDGRLVTDAVSETVRFAVVDVETRIATSPQNTSFVYATGTGASWRAGHGERLPIALAEGEATIRQLGAAAGADAGGADPPGNWSLDIACDAAAAGFRTAEGEVTFSVLAGRSYACSFTNAGVAIAEIPMDVVAFAAGDAPQRIEVRSVGAAAFDVDRVTLAGGDFEIVDDGCTGARVDPDRHCHIVVGWLGSGGGGRLDIDYVGAVAGDSRVLLIRR